LSHAQKGRKCVLRDIFIEQLKALELAGLNVTLVQTTLFHFCLLDKEETSVVSLPVVQ